MAVFRPASRRMAIRPRRKSIKARSTDVVRRRRSFAGFSVPRGPSMGGFPETLTTTLRYNDLFYFSTSSVAPVGNIFRMNSVFDPDYTGTGHQPLYFDQLAAVYGRYAVLGTKITATFTPRTGYTEASPKGPFTVGITQNNDGSFPASAQTMIEQNGTVYADMGTERSGNNVKTLVATYSPLRDVGLPASDDTLGASVTGNPNTTYWSYVWFSDKSGSTGSMCANVTIEFRVKFLRQTSIATS